MPVIALKPCKYSGCHQPVTTTRFCEVHKAEENKSWRHPYKETAESRGYGPAWVRLRKKILKRDPVCKGCGIRPSTQCDHVRPKTLGGTDDPANLQGLCSGCHKEKTQREK